MFTHESESVHGLYNFNFIVKTEGFLKVTGRQVRCNKSSAVAEIGNRLALIDMGQKLGRRAAFFGGGRGSWAHIQHNVILAEAYLHTKWQLDPSTRLATIDMGQKLRAVPLLGG